MPWRSSRRRARSPTFLPVVEGRRDLWCQFRMFTMTDDAERKDGLLPVVYPRSLLYFVSGLLETGPDGKGEPGDPLVGLSTLLRPGARR